MSYARTLRRSMKEHLRPDSLVPIEQDNRVLHPRKGWRYPSVRTMHATMLTAEIKRGLRPWSSLALHDMLKSERLI